MIDIKIKKETDWFAVSFVINDKASYYRKIRGKYSKKHGRYFIESSTCPENSVEGEETIFIPGDDQNSDDDKLFFRSETIKDVLESFIYFKKELKKE